MYTTKVVPTEAVGRSVTSKAADVASMHVRKNGRWEERAQSKKTARRSGQRSGSNLGPGGQGSIRNPSAANQPKQPKAASRHHGKASQRSSIGGRPTEKQANETSADGRRRGRRTIHRRTAGGEAAGQRSIGGRPADRHQRDNLNETVRRTFQRSK
ncbi:hypothetical protein ZHAS_00001069 [Anopheles sinensis]|uniref:Uncharacterized protein n=1 Tax=Anopheles sinensis TaxID=74873 RepID=A0A084VB04_ANOSI|nr:hypothetical protein ZHAS_00001069 [Anopheles sinensis]